MSDAIRQIEPVSLWKNFADLNDVPRPSKKEEKVIAFAKSFGEKLGLSTEVDPVGNVIIRKPATPGMENRKPVVMQSHLDMVCQQNAGTNHDFENTGIDMYIDGDWVRAKGTTLGADNGIGVATIMAILESTDIPHPAIEALFTIDEETGMTGAIGLEEGRVKGKILLNLDTEDDRELTIGCAGGIDVTSTIHFQTEKAPYESRFMEVAIKGLHGGHSGMDIHLGFGNANKLMNRLVYSLSEVADVRLVSIDGGSLRNAIPRESFAKISVPSESWDKVVQVLEEIKTIYQAEYGTTDEHLDVQWSESKEIFEVLSKADHQKVINAIYAIPNGIYRMSPDIKDLVQTSNNTARVILNNGDLTVMCLTRSSVDSEKMDLANAIDAVFRNIGATTTMTGSYPGWTPAPKSDLVEMMHKVYLDVFKEEPLINACHAGLECGIIGERCPGMEMISFGPNIRGAHSPDERVQISSVQKYWGYVLEILKNIPQA